MPRLISRLVASLFLIIALGINVFGQSPLAKRNWYFGNSEYGIRFARPNYDITLDSANRNPGDPFSQFGNATASSPETGDLIFYTDGQFLYDASFQLMDGIVVSNPALLLNADLGKNQNRQLSPHRAMMSVI